MATVEQHVPPLAAGDKLNRAEFLRRWEAHPEIKKAELIGGIVYMPSPVSIEHGEHENAAGTWAGVYSAATPGTAAANNTTLLMLDDSPQGDGHLRILPEYGGRAWVERGFLHGAPELMIEICRSSSSYDLHQKLELYQSAGVQEYLAVLLYEQEIRWHALENAAYETLPAGKDGIWRSRVFPGLWLDGKALLDGKLAQVLTKLQDGLASPEHQEFVAQLAAKKS